MFLEPAEALLRLASDPPAKMPAAGQIKKVMAI